MSRRQVSSSEQELSDRLTRLVEFDIENGITKNTQAFLNKIGKDDRAKIVGMSAVDTEEGGMALLYYAAQEAAQEMVDLLIKYGANVNQKDAAGDTALHAIIANHDVDENKKFAIATLLLMAGAKNTPNAKSHKPLQSVGQRETHLFKLLSSFERYDNAPPLIHKRVKALAKKEIDGVASEESPLGKDSTIEVKKQLAAQPVYHASQALSAMQARFEAAVKIKQYVAQRDKVDPAELGDGIADSYFIRDGRIYSKDKAMPIEESSSEYKEILEALFLEQQNFFHGEFANDLRDTSRLEASEILKYVTLPDDRKKIVNHTSLKGKMTLLHRAAYAGHVAAVEFLLQNSADVEATDIKGLSAFHYAAIAKNSVSQPQNPVKQSQDLILPRAERPEINSKVAIYKALMRSNGGIDYQGEDSSGYKALDYFNGADGENILLARDKFTGNSKSSAAEFLDLSAAEVTLQKVTISGPATAVSRANVSPSPLRRVASISSGK